MFFLFPGPPALAVNIMKSIRNTFAIVQWDEVDDYIPTNYTVTWTSNGTNSIQSHTLIEQSSYTITGLTLDTVYTVTVTTANMCGTGPTSTASVIIYTGTYIAVYYFHYCINEKFLNRFIYKNLKIIRVFENRFSKQQNHSDS